MPLFATTHSKLKKATDGTDTQVATCMNNKWMVKINGKKVYNIRGLPRMKEGERRSQFLPPPKGSVTKHQKTKKNDQFSDQARG